MVMETGGNMSILINHSVAGGKNMKNMQLISGMCIALFANLDRVRLTLLR